MIPEISEWLKIVENDKSSFTLRSYKTSAERFFDFTKSSTLEDLKKITSSTLREYQTFLLGTKVEKSTINAYMRPLKALFNWMVDNEYLERSPFEKVKFLKEPKQVMTYLSEQEVDLMINSCPKIEEKLILAMLVSLGLRRSELVNLKVNQISGNCLTVIGKGSKERKLYFPPDVFDLYNEYMSKRKDKNFEYVFRSKMDCQYSTEAIRQKVKKAALLAGIDPERIEDISCHTLRRTFATNLVESNIDLRVIQATMGHQNINTTVRYANARNSAVEKAMISQKRILQ